MTDRLLHCRNLSLQRGTQRVLESVGISIHAGECVALVGANGAGKTSLLKCLIGLFPNAHGEIISGGLDPRCVSPITLSAHYAYAPQSPHSAWDYTLEELSHLSTCAEKYLHWIERFSLTQKLHHKLSKLSGGERKAAHLCLSLSVVKNPQGKILLLDEPTASLDICRTEILSTVIHELSQQGAAILVATHDLKFAQQCQRAIILKDGRVVSDGVAAAVLSPDIIRDVWGFSSASA